MNLPPIGWKSFVFLFQRSDDRDDHYTGAAALDGRLRFSRSQNLWLASVHGAVAVREGGPDGRGDRDAARTAIEAAVEALRRRVAADQVLLARIEEES
ncbi:MAG: hypothetical protein RL685_5166 [Pseudomonadota bacterium]|jgi:hypothetical protein